jgi:type VI secretion system secreted protein VgrG
MATITQAGQPFRLSTPLGPDALLIDQFSGAEKISAPFLFTVDALSEDDAISAGDVLRKEATLTFDLPSGGQRVVHGLVRRFAQLGQRDQLTYYRAEIVPWLWFLSLSTDLRIFQNMTVLEIVEQVFQSLGYSDFEVKCSRSYPVREYCVQYRETHLDFVSRLLEEEGIFYFFEHSAARHVLVLADDNSTLPECAGSSQARLSGEPLDDEDVVLSLVDEHVVHIGTVTLNDYDYLQPSLGLEQSVSGDGREEIYDYPGLYAKPADGDRYALIRLQQREAGARIVTGSGTMRNFVAGCTFQLTGHYRRDVNASYLLAEVTHSGHAGSYRAWDDRQPHYENSFTALPQEVPYRPAQRTAKPTVRGSQTAVVVGPGGEEIWVDKHARVKVQFHWDREGSKDENSSCWVRVASSWAGKGWGWIQIPRIGQEVIVDFLEGDPDRPIITGRVYNAEQVPPYALPANQTQSGVKSRSSKGGGTDNFNEIRLEDLKGSELVYIHAEKDKQVVVENNRDEQVGHDETISIGDNQTIGIGKNRSETVGADESISIGSNRSESVGKNEDVAIGDNRSVSIGKNESLDVGKNRDQAIGANEKVTVAQKRSTQVGKDDVLDVGKKLLITVSDEIVIKTGKSSIQMKKDGTITISGKDITLKGSGKINAKASSDITLKGSKIKQN